MSRSINERSLIVDLHPQSHISEAYRTLRTNTQFSAVDGALQVILITSTQPGEGKTTTTANLAITYAQDNRNVLIIDADLRKPAMHQLFVKSNYRGLTHLLTGQHGLEDMLLDTHVPHLSLITSGPVPPNPSEILGSRRMSALMDELRGKFDVILIDSPPALAVTDAQILASISDGVVLVVHSGKVKRNLVKKAKANLEHVKARILGVVLNNQVRSPTDPYYYNYYGDRGQSAEG